MKKNRYSTMKIDEIKKQPKPNWLKWDRYWYDAVSYFNRELEFSKYIIYLIYTENEEELLYIYYFTLKWAKIGKK